jgi:cytochrome c biogenesis protein CcmG/thiol:disulfide interchange protein DsbE
MVIVGGGILLACLGPFALRLAGLIPRSEPLAGQPAEPALDPHALRSARIPAPAIGTPAPDFALTSLDGTRVTLQALLRAGRPIVLFFVTPSCEPCRALATDFRRWQQEHGDVLTLVLLSSDHPEINRAKFAEHGLPFMLLQRDREVNHAYGVYATPSAVVVWPAGTIASAPARGVTEIRQLVSEWNRVPWPEVVPAART